MKDGLKEERTVRRNEEGEDKENEGREAGIKKKR